MKQTLMLISAMAMLSIGWNETLFAQNMEKNKTMMQLTEQATENRKVWFSESIPAEATTDPELIEILDNFTFDEVQNHVKLDMKTRILAVMASTIAQNTLSEYRRMLEAAWNNGVTPVEIKETLYQLVAYVGRARVYDFLEATNDFLQSKDVALPLPQQGTTHHDNHQEIGLAKQKELFGETIDKMYQSSPANQLHIQQYLSLNCFGDYYTRNGLDDKMREIVTFSILVSLGGCDNQVKGHVQGNVNVGNNKQVLLDVTTQLLPYIGYPRTLNALRCINEVIPE